MCGSFDTTRPIELRSLSECKDFRNEYGPNGAPLAYQRLHRSTIPLLHFACEHAFVVVCAVMCVSMYGTALSGVIFKIVICILYNHSRRFY